MGLHSENKASSPFVSLLQVIDYSVKGTRVLSDGTAGGVEDVVVATVGSEKDALAVVVAAAASGAWMDLRVMRSSR